MTIMVTAALLFCMSNSFPGQWALSDGTQVSVVFVLPSQKVAWRLDGSPVNLRSLPRTISPVWSAKDTDPILVTLIHPAAPNRYAPTVQFKLPATSELGASFTTPSLNKRIWVSGYHTGPSQPSEQDVAIGVGTAPWTTVGWLEYKKGGGTVQHGTSFKPRVGGKSNVGPYVFVSIPTPKTSVNTAYRVIVKDRAGAEMPLEHSSPSPEGVAGFFYAFVGSLSDVGNVEFQTRPLQWHTIKVAHFKPAP